MGTVLEHQKLHQPSALLRHQQAGTGAQHAVLVDAADQTTGAHAQLVEHVDLRAVAEMAAQVVGHLLVGGAPRQPGAGLPVQRIELLEDLRSARR